LTDRADGLPGKPLIDYAITVPMTKELCMIQRLPRGKKCREYFIRCEDEKQMKKEEE